MGNIDLEMEEITKLYGYMNDDDKDNWSINEAQAMYDDEVKYCEEHSINNPLSSVDVLYDTIREFIEQDEDDNEEE